LPNFARDGYAGHVDAEDRSTNSGRPKADKVRSGVGICFLLLLAGFYCSDAARVGTICAF
jgi:hypothetical protein